MSRGKNQRAVSAKANAEALQRIAELEEEVATYRSAGVVVSDYLKTLAENERLRAKAATVDEATSRAAKAELLASRMSDRLREEIEARETQQRRVEWLFITLARQLSPSLYANVYTEWKTRGGIAENVVATKA